ncbi:MAG: dihydrofolate reductase family protein [Flavitalea sp.]
MGKIIVTQFITLDGVTEAPGGDETNHPHGGWQNGFRSPEGGKYKVDELAATNALLMGRKTYDQFAKYWPAQSGQSFGDRMNSLPKFVVSTTLPKADWNNTKILKDVVKDVAELRRNTDGNILIYGSATLSKSLIHHELVDELHLLLYPVIVGGGLKLFDDNFEMKKFNLTNSQTFTGGVILLEYSTISKCV